MFNEVLKTLRTEAKMTQVTLAEALGVSKGAVAMWETGKRVPDSEMLVSIARLFGVSVDYLLLAEQTDGVPSNAGRVTKKRLPLLGNVACGEPRFAEQEVEMYIDADADEQADFCLRAVGDSMINARIFDGDILFVRSQTMVDDGEIAVVLIDSETTVKRFFYDRENSTVTLIPENPTYKPMRFTGSELEGVRVLGKVLSGHYEVV